MVISRTPLEIELVASDIPLDGLPEIELEVWMIAVTLFPITRDRVLEINGTSSRGVLVKGPKPELVVGVVSAPEGVPLEELNNPNPLLASEAASSAIEAPIRRLDVVWEALRALVSGKLDTLVKDPLRTDVEVLSPFKSPEPVADTVDVVLPKFPTSGVSDITVPIVPVPDRGAVEVLAAEPSKGPGFVLEDPLSCDPTKAVGIIRVSATPEPAEAEINERDIDWL